MPSRTEFERLSVPHLRAAYTLAFWLMQSPADAEDVVQDAYLRALRAFANFKGEDIRPWLLAIVRNAAYRALGNRKRSAAIISLDEILAADKSAGSAGDSLRRLADETPGAEERMILDVDKGYLARALSDLPEAFREVLLLREIEGLSYRDIAEVTGVPAGTVMSRLSRARTELRAALRRAIARDEGHAV